MGVGSFYWCVCLHMCVAGFTPAAAAGGGAGHGEAYVFSNWLLNTGCEPELLTWYGRCCCCCCELLSCLEGLLLTARGAPRATPW